MRRLLYKICIVLRYVLKCVHAWLLQEAEIKKAAKRGDKQTCGVYAKQLVRLRQQKTKSLGLSAQISSTGHQMTVSNHPLVLRLPPFQIVGGKASPHCCEHYLET